MSAKITLTVELTEEQAQALEKLSARLFATQVSTLLESVSEVRDALDAIIHIKIALNDAGFEH